MFDRRLGYGLLTLYTILAAIAVNHNPAWLIDAVVTLATILIILIIRKPLRLDTTDLILVNIMLLVHNAGFFGLYAQTFIVDYDVYAHLINAGLLATIAYRTLQRSTTLSTTGLILNAICITATLALGVELIEYAGPLVVTEQNAAIGLAGTGHPGSDYQDTMKDILMNIIGATLGAVLTHAMSRKKKNPAR